VVHSVCRNKLVIKAFTPLTLTSTLLESADSIPPLTVGTKENTRAVDGPVILIWKIDQNVVGLEGMSLAMYPSI